MERVGRESLVKSGIEHHDLRLIREQFGSHPNALNACRIMQRREIRQFFDSSHDAFGNENGLAKTFSAMSHAMADRLDIESALFAQDFDHPQKRGTMIRPWHHLLVFNPIEINQF